MNISKRDALHFFTLIIFLLHSLLFPCPNAYVLGGCLLCVFNLDLREHFLVVVLLKTGRLQSREPSLGTHKTFQVLPTAITAIRTCKKPHFWKPVAQQHSLISQVDLSVLALCRHPVVRHV